MSVIILKKIKNKPGRTRIRLVVTYLSIIVLTLLFIATYILASISQYLYNQVKVQTLSKANVIANVVVDYIEKDNDLLQFVIRQVNVDDTARIIVTDAQATVLYDSSTDNSITGKTLVKDEIVAAIKGKDTVTLSQESGGSTIHAAATVVSESQNIGVVYVSLAAKTTDEFIGEMRWILFVISIVVCLLIGVLSSVMADVIISPIEKLTQMIRKMQNENTAKKVPVQGKDEIAQLSQAFNNLTDKLNEMEEKRREFVSNASHELKTPLSSIKLLSETVLSMNELDTDAVKEFMGDINGETDRLTKIIERLLQLTKLDSQANKLELKITDINDMSERIIKSLAPVAENKEITLQLFTRQEVLAMVDREKFWQVIYNITDNAIKYTPTGGNVGIFVMNDGDFCRVEIEDSGIGIPEQDIDKIFDRFYRVDKARSRESGGTGLGLAIVNDVVKLHNGKIMVDSTENVGTKFIIIIPKNLDM